MTRAGACREFYVLFCNYRLTDNFGDTAPSSSDNYAHKVLTYIEYTANLGHIRTE